MVELHSSVAIVICGLLCCVSGQDSKCEDIDTAACKLMEVSQPDLCDGMTPLAMSACPRYCHLCPIECHHCNATVLDYHDCNNTMVCEKDEVCMIKELKSFVDGHHEYEMTCELKQLCDGGSGLTIPFGKRTIENRDISVTCCDTDLCNYPGPNSCYKDIVFLVDVSSVVLVQERLNIIRTLFEVVQQLDIGIYENLVGLYGYDTKIHKQFELLKYTDKTDLLRHLQRTDLLNNLNSLRSDLDGAVEFLVDHALTMNDGDRPNFSDAVIIIGDSETAGTTQVTLAHRLALERASHDVIVVSIGSGSGTDQLATDNSHMLHVPSSSAMDTVLVPQLVDLIKAC